MECSEGEKLRILLVEDEDRSVRDAIDSIRREIPHAIVDIASSRDEAIAVLKDESFDLLLCDIRLPPHTDSADVQEAHGLSVHAASRTLCPGTPLIFLTGFATSRETRGQLSQGEVATVYGIEHHPLVDLVDKDDVPALEAKLAALNFGFERVHAVDLVGVDEGEHEIFRRAACGYAVSIGQSHVEVQLAPGMSGATVGRVHLSGPPQAPATIFLKVSQHTDAADEYQRYRQQVSNRLAPGLFAPTHEPVSGGLGRFSALISTVAEGTRSLFDVVAASPEEGAAVVRRLRDGLRPWTAMPRDLPPVTLAELRSRRLSDEQLQLSRTASDLARTLESVEIELREVICHGDLHGENVLVDSDGRPVLIDFGDTGPGPSPLDPVTLELSLLFHRAGPVRGLPGLGDLHWAAWPDLEAFIANSDLAPFIRETRDWARELASERQILAFAYAHAVRQIKYDDVEEDWALDVASAAALRILS